MKVHIESEARVADHCSVHALHDSSEFAFKQRCNHKHDELCNQCEALHAALHNIGEAVQGTVFHNEDDRDEILFLYKSAQRSIQSRRPTN